MRITQNSIYELNYQDFKTESHNVTFQTDTDKTVLISFPLVDSVPDCIKSVLNKFIRDNYYERLQYTIIEGCLSAPCNLLLDARIQVNYTGTSVAYYIAITISDLLDWGIFVDESLLISEDDATNIYNELIDYCKNTLNKMLFRSYQLPRMEH